MLLCGHTSKYILSYFRTVLDILKHQQTTIKQKSCKWFQDRSKFVGNVIAAEVTQPANSKKEAFSKLERPNTWGYLCMLIFLLIFYSQLFPSYELDMIPWRCIFSKHPQPGKLSQKENMGLIQNI